MNLKHGEVFPQNSYSVKLSLTGPLHWKKTPGHDTECISTSVLSLRAFWVILMTIYPLERDNKIRNLWGKIETDITRKYRSRRRLISKHCHTSLVSCFPVVEEEEFASEQTSRLLYIARTRPWWLSELIPIWRYPVLTHNIDRERLQSDHITLHINLLSRSVLLQVEGGGSGQDIVSILTLGGYILTTLNTTTRYHPPHQQELAFVVCCTTSFYWWLLSEVTGEHWRLCAGTGLSNCSNSTSDSFVGRLYRVNNEGGGLWYFQGLYSQGKVNLLKGNITCVGNSYYHHYYIPIISLNIDVPRYCSSMKTGVP